MHEYEQALASRVPEEGMDAMAIHLYPVSPWGLEYREREGVDQPLSVKASQYQD